jgi:RNA-binding protein
MFFNIHFIMKLFHNITVSVFIKENEDYDSIRQSFLSIFPFDLTKSRILLNEQKVSTFNDKIITILEVQLINNKIINLLIDFIKSKLSVTDKDMVINQIDSRVDENCDFFFRISKSKLIEEGKFVIVDDGNCYHFKCHIASYPQKKEKAISIVKEYLLN